MKSDREFLDQLYIEADAILAQRRVDRRKAVKIKYAILSTTAFILILITSTIVWQSIINSLQYKSSHPDNRITSYTSYNVNALLSKVELIQNSDIVIKGLVKKLIGCRWTNPDYILGTEKSNSINSYYEIEILNSYKGDIGGKQSVVIVVSGGIIGKTEITSRSSPTLQIGDLIICFLKRSEVISPLTFYPYNKSYYILGAQQGVYFYDKDQNIF
jgi:hypothetical protein